MMTERQALAARLAVFTFVALVCFWRLGSTPLLETDEGFAANRAASFQRHHTWRLSFDDVNDDRPQFRKPPLLYWAVAALYPVTGHNTWSVRLPVAASALALCWILYRINRRHFDEPTALGAVVLFVSVPFVLVHMRTAMLEMPLMALTFAAVYALAYLPEKRGTAVLAGLAAGGAVLVKGSPGFLAIAVAVLHALVLNGFSARSLRRASTALAVTALVFWIYAFKVVPHRWQDTLLTSMFIQEGTHRTLSKNFSGRVHALYEPLWVTARFLLGLAVPGLLLALTRRTRGTATWFALLLLLCVPVAWVGAKQVVPYARYFLPLYPFLATLAALAVTGLVRHRGAASALLVVVAALTFAWPAARDRNPSIREMPHPGMKEIAERIPALVPEGEKVILAAGKLKCHQLLFYGRRAVETQAAWFERGIAPGSVRHAVAQPGRFVALPGVSSEVVAEAGGFQLLRLTAARPAR